MICGCFPIVVKAVLHDFDRYLKRFTCVVNMPRSYVPVLLAMQSCVASRSAFYRGQRYIYEWCLALIVKRLSRNSLSICISIKLPVLFVLHHESVSYSRHVDKQLLSI